MTSFNFDIFKCYMTLIFDWMLKDSTRTTFELPECDWATTQISMSSIRVASEKLNFDFLLNIVTT